MKTSTCYMCDAPETSVEHVPPRGLFPEQKDLPPGVDLRKQYGGISTNSTDCGPSVRSLQALPAQ